MLFGRDSVRLLRAADLDCVRALVALTDFEGERVAFTKVVERDADKLAGVEEEILLLAIALDEPETLIGETGDSSCLHMQMRIFRLVNIKYRWLELKLDPHFSGSALDLIREGYHVSHLLSIEIWVYQPVLETGDGLKLDASVFSRSAMPTGFVR